MLELQRVCNVVRVNFYERLHHSASPKIKSPTIKSWWWWWKWHIICMNKHFSRWLYSKHKHSLSYSRNFCYLSDQFRGTCDMTDGERAGTAKFDNKVSWFPLLLFCLPSKNKKCGINHIGIVNATAQRVSKWASKRLSEELSAYK